MPELTSLKVPPQVRDRFTLAAQHQGISVRALLDQLSRRVEDEVLMAEVAQQMLQMRADDLLHWSGYIEEGDQWEEDTIERVHD